MFSKPEQNIQQLEITPGMHIADIGAGSGLYTLAAAKRASEGKVYAIDVQKDLLDRIATEAQNQNLHNVEIVWGDAEEHQGTRLREESIDYVIIANTLFQIDNKESLFKEATRILKRGGKLLLVDWTESFGGLGPQDSQIITKNAAQSIAESHGFKFGKEIEAGEHHWGSIFYKE